jgi:hypothetical protein
MMARVQVEEMAMKLNSKTKNQEELPLMYVPGVRWGALEGRGGHNPSQEAEESRCGCEEGAS